MSVKLSELMVIINGLNATALRTDYTHVEMRDATTRQKFDVAFVRNREGRWTIANPMVVEPD